MDGAGTIAGAVAVQCSSGAASMTDRTGGRVRAHTGSGQVRKGNDGLVQWQCNCGHVV